MEKSVSSGVNAQDLEKSTREKLLAFENATHTHTHPHTLSLTRTSFAAAAAAAAPTKSSQCARSAQGSVFFQPLTLRLLTRRSFRTRGFRLSNLQGRI